MDEKRETLLVKRLREKGFEGKQLVSILDIIIITCPHCWDGDEDCQCENDERD